MLLRAPGGTSVVLLAQHTADARDTIRRDALQPCQVGGQLNVAHLRIARRSVGAEAVVEHVAPHDLERLFARQQLNNVTPSA